MRVLLIYCHPNPESFTAALRAAAERGLAAAGHDVRVADLYGEEFDPVLRREERAAYHTAGENERPIAAEIERIKWAEALVFVYPTWWYGQPAMLKGWLDRVWVPHVTFTMPTETKPIGRNMTNIRIIVAVTTLGSPRCSQFITSNHTGAAPLVPLTFHMGEPEKLPIHTPTV